MCKSEPGRGKGQDKGLKCAWNIQGGSRPVQLHRGGPGDTAVRDGTGGNRARCCREGLCFYPGTDGKPLEGLEEL